MNQLISQRVAALEVAKKNKAVAKKDEKATGNNQSENLQKTTHEKNLATQNEENKLGADDTIEYGK